VQRKKPEQYGRIGVVTLILRAAHGHSFDGPICRESCRIYSGGSAFIAGFLHSWPSDSYEHAA